MGGRSNVLYNVKCDVCPCVHSEAVSRFSQPLPALLLKSSTCRKCSTINQEKCMISNEIHFVYKYNMESQFVY